MLSALNPVSYVTNPSLIRLTGLISLVVNVAGLYVWALLWQQQAANEKPLSVSLQLAASREQPATASSLDRSELKAVTRSQERLQDGADKLGTGDQLLQVTPKESPAIPLGSIEPKLPVNPPDRSDAVDLTPPSSPPTDILLDRSPEALRELFRGLEAPAEPTRNQSSNGAVIMDRTLIGKLKSLQSQAQSPRVLEDQTADISYGAGGWQQRFELNGMCFTVQMADPLDALSQEVWYRVSCPRQR